jgi:hypothetical protein
MTPPLPLQPVIIAVALVAGVTSQVVALTIDPELWVMSF